MAAYININRLVKTDSLPGFVLCRCGNYCGLGHVWCCNGHYLRRVVTQEYRLLMPVLEVAILALEQPSGETTGV